MDIRYENDKNAESIPATVISDDGGATLTVKLGKRGLHIRVHKGHTYLRKGSIAYQKHFGPGSKTCLKREYIPVKEDKELAQSPKPIQLEPENKQRYNLRSSRK